MCCGCGRFWRDPSECSRWSRYSLTSWCRVVTAKASASGVSGWLQPPGTRYRTRAGQDRSRPLPTIVSSMAGDLSQRRVSDSQRRLVGGGLSHRWLSALVRVLRRRRRAATAARVPTRGARMRTEWLSTWGRPRSTFDEKCSTFAARGQQARVFMSKLAHRRGCALQLAICLPLQRGSRRAVRLRGALPAVGMRAVGALSWVAGDADRVRVTHRGCWWSSRLLVVERSVAPGSIARGVTPPLPHFVHGSIGGGGAAGLWRAAPFCPATTSAGSIVRPWQATGWWPARA